MMEQENRYMCTRNPSPPPLTDSEKEAISADYIGDTLFSKRWVLSMLLKLYKHNKDDIYDNLTTQTGQFKNSDRAQDVDTKFEDEMSLNRKFENDVCELWDSSANSDVATFIFENQGKDIFIDVLNKALLPRLAEICFGILGNLICVDDINIHLSQDAIFRSSMLQYLSISDALSLVELTRLLNVCFSHGNTLSLWMSSIMKSSAMEQAVSILGNSLNVQLLQHTIKLIDVIFDNDATILDKYANSSLFYSVKECYHVIRCNNEELVADLLYILQLVSTTEKGVQQLAEDHCIFLLLRECIFDEHNLFVERKPSLLASVFSVLGCLLFAKPEEITGLIDDNIKILECLMIVLHDRVVELLNNSKSDNENDTYVPVYFELFHDICQTFATYKESRNFHNIVSHLKENELKIKNVFEWCSREDTPVEWKKFVKSLMTLNQQHCILNFHIELH